MFQILQTVGIKELGCNDINLVISLLKESFRAKEDFLVFKNVNGQTVITDSNENILTTIDKPLFKEEVYAVFGEEDSIQYFILMLPCEY